MENPTVRGVIATLIGILVAGLVVALAEGAGHVIYPTPEGIDITKPEDQLRLMEIIPFGAKVAVVIAWFLGALAGTCTARKIATVKWPAWIVTALMVAASIGTTAMFPHPTWMIACAVGLPLLALWIAGRLVPLRA